jgi:hypothetical protein
VYVRAVHVHKFAYRSAAQHHGTTWWQSSPLLPQACLSSVVHGHASPLLPMGMQRGSVRQLRPILCRNLLRSSCKSSTVQLLAQASAQTHAVLTPDKQRHDAREHSTATTRSSPQTAAEATSALEEACQAQGAITTAVLSQSVMGFHRAPLHPVPKKCAECTQETAYSSGLAQNCIPDSPSMVRDVR